MNPGQRPRVGPPELAGSHFFEEVIGVEDGARAAGDVAVLPLMRLDPAPLRAFEEQ